MHKDKIYEQGASTIGMMSYLNYIYGTNLQRQILLITGKLKIWEKL